MKSSESESNPLQSPSKAEIPSRAAQSGRTAEPPHIEIRVPNFFRRRTFHDTFNVLGSAHEKLGV